METGQILDLFKSLHIPIREIRLTGGCSRIAAWCQIQADLYGKPVADLECPEATLLGAAVLAAVGAKAYATVNAAVCRMVRPDTVYAPRRAAVVQYRRLRREFGDIYRATEQAGLFRRTRRRE